MPPIEDLTKRLGLRGLLRRGGENWRTAEIKSLNNQITEFNKTYWLLKKQEYASTQSIKDDIEAIFQAEGSKLWPDNTDRLNDCAWLYRVGDIPEYPQDLFFSLHIRTLRPLFESLLLMKLDRYHVNHIRLKNIRLPSESTLTDLTSAGSGNSSKSLIVALKVPNKKSELQAILDKEPSPTSAWVATQLPFKRKHDDRVQDTSKRSKGQLSQKRVPTISQLPSGIITEDGDVSNTQIQGHHPNLTNSIPARRSFVRCDSVGVPEQVHEEVDRDRSSDSSDEDDGDVFAKVPVSIYSSTPESHPSNPVTPGPTSGLSPHYSLPDLIARQNFVMSNPNQGHHATHTSNERRDSGKFSYSYGGKASHQADASTPPVRDSTSQTRSLIRRTNWVREHDAAIHVSPSSIGNSGDISKEPDQLPSPQTENHGTNHPSPAIIHDNDENAMNQTSFATRGSNYDGTGQPSDTTTHTAHGTDDHSTKIPPTTTQQSTTTETAKSSAPLPFTDPTNLADRCIDLILAPLNPTSSNPPARRMVELSSCLQISHLFTSIKILKKTLSDRGVEDVVVSFKDSTVDDGLNWDISNDKPGQKLWEQLLRVLVEKTEDYCPIEARIEV